MFSKSIRYFISISLIMLLACGSTYLCLYLLINAEYIRANAVASQAQAQVEQLYEQMRAFTPNDATLIAQEQPLSGTYAFGLSDDADQYAFVRAYQTYDTRSSLSDVLASYSHAFEERNWVSIHKPSKIIGRVFQQPNNDSLLVGLCEVHGAPKGMTRYTVFFDFDESFLSETCPDRWCYLARHYCGAR